MVVNVIIIDAQGSFEYTTEGYTFEFDETSTVDVFDGEMLTGSQDFE